MQIADIKSRIRIQNVRDQHVVPVVVDGLQFEKCVSHRHTASFVEENDIQEFQSLPLQNSRLSALEYTFSARSPTWS